MAASVKRHLLVGSSRIKWAFRGRKLSVVKRCLKCDQPFESLGPENRRCENCRGLEVNKFVAQWGW